MTGKVGNGDLRDVQVELARVVERLDLTIKRLDGVEVPGTGRICLYEKDRLAVIEKEQRNVRWISAGISSSTAIVVTFIFWLITTIG